MLFAISHNSSGLLVLRLSLASLPDLCACAACSSQDERVLHVVQQRVDKRQ